MTVLAVSLSSAYAVEESGSTPSEGFHMTGMKRDMVTKETEAMTFKGMRRETATRVFKETSKKNN